MRKTASLMATTAAVLLLAAGVALAAKVDCTGGRCVGTNDPDRLIGTSSKDRMNAKQASDTLLAFTGDDVLFGDRPLIPVEKSNTDGDDRLYAKNGEDVLVGFGGGDLLRGGGRTDTIDAYDGSDATLNPGQDTILADGGKDFIFALDGFKDTIDCGDNVDTVYFDEGLDEVANCEIENPEEEVTSASAQSLPSLRR
jgi:Ca2+-binding RTX toxin-like protein